MIPFIRATPRGRLLQLNLDGTYRCAWFIGSSVGLLIALAGCGAAPLSSDIPYGFDLSGEWQLVVDESDEPPDLSEVMSKQLNLARRGRSVDVVSSLAFADKDFPVLRSSEMNIEQDANSIGIGYSSGGYRDYSWSRIGGDTSEVKRIEGWQYVAGWNEGTFTLRLSRASIRGVEEYRLTQHNRRLEVTVSIETSKDKYKLVRVFERVA